MWKWSDLKRIILRKSEFSDSAIITWPVSYPTEDVGGTAYAPEDAHVTILYIPNIDDDELGFSKEDVIDAIRETEWDIMMFMTVTGMEWFGPENDIPVLRVEHHYLEKYRNEVKASLAKRGIVVEETYPEYKPHVTIPVLAAERGLWPARLMGGPVELWWGDEKIRIDNG